ncbi:universal stress protein [Nocardia salmonicida]|uniref:universal stress protein n=1 Tax=Nocardia salmonicida TaxID=53431 RepID=UPI0033E73E13
MLVGVDGSPASHRAVEFALLEACHRDIGLVAISVGTHPHPGTRSVGMTAHIHRLLEEGLEGYAENFPCIDVTQLVAHGDPASRMAQESVRAQLIVLGRRTVRFTWSRRGSVSHTVLHGAKVPLVLIGHQSLNADASDTADRKMLHDNVIRAVIPTGFKPADPPEGARPHVEPTCPTLDRWFREQIRTSIDYINAAMRLLQRNMLEHNAFRHTFAPSHGNSPARVAPDQRTERSGQSIAIVSGTTHQRTHRAYLATLRVSIQAPDTERYCTYIARPKSKKL